METNEKSKAELPTEERDIFQCKVCQQMTVRILRGKFNAFNKRYTDEKGGTHNGRVCALCHRNRARENMRKLREKRKNAIIPIE